MCDELTRYTIKIKYTITEIDEMYAGKKMSEKTAFFLITEKWSIGGLSDWDNSADELKWWIKMVDKYFGDILGIHNLEGSGKYCVSLW